MPADTATLVRAIVLRTNTRGRAWLVSELERVTDAMMAGAATIKSLSFEGGSASGEVEMRTDQLVEIFTQALEEFDGTSQSQGAMLIPRIAGFDLNG